MSGHWFERPPMEGIVKNGSFRAYGHTIGPAQRDLLRWVGGHPLTPGLIQELGGLDFNSYLDIEGKKIPGTSHLSWSVRFAQYGHPDRNGFVGGASSAEDACDQACELIREEEAERLLFLAPAGLA